MDENKISVIMGIYNCAATLPEAIESILHQTYQNWELIMCDDASTDDTYSVAAKYQAQYANKVVLIKNEENSKLSYTLNHCLQYATGKYVARMDGDDISAPDRFEKQIEYLRSHPEVDLVGAAMQRFDERGIGSVIRKPEQPDKYSMVSITPFNHATIMTYRCVYESLGGYTVSKRTDRAQDYDLWFKFFKHGFRGDNLQQVLYYVRDDGAAHKRRTITARWHGFQTTCIGFRMLGFPRSWLIKPAVLFAVKSIVPTKLILFYHRNMERKASARKE